MAYRRCLAAQSQQLCGLLGILLLESHNLADGGAVGGKVCIQRVGAFAVGSIFETLYLLLDGCGTYLLGGVVILIVGDVEYRRGHTLGENIFYAVHLLGSRKVAMLGYKLADVDRLANLHSHR